MHAYENNTLNQSIQIFVTNPTSPDFGGQWFNKWKWDEAQDLAFCHVCCHLAFLVIAIVIVILVSKCHVIAIAINYIAKVIAIFMITSDYSNKLNVWFKA